MKFTCFIGETVSHTFNLKNTTSHFWNKVETHLSSPSWSIGELTSIEAQESKEFELKFHPLDPITQEATLTCVFPDGNGLVFNLMGIGKDPSPQEQLITKEVSLGTKHIQNLKIHNPDNHSKTYTINIEELTPTEAVSLKVWYVFLIYMILFQGKEQVKIEGLKEHTYVLEFLAHIEGTFEFLVHLLDEDSMQRQSYRFNITVTRSEDFTKLKLTSPVRQSTLENLKVFNPLSKEVEASLSCSERQVKSTT